jgi:hypothetical protein
MTVEWGRRGTQTQTGWRSCACPDSPQHTLGRATASTAEPIDKQVSHLRGRQVTGQLAVVPLQTGNGSFQGRLQNTAVSQQHVNALHSSVCTQAQPGHRARDWRGRTSGGGGHAPRRSLWRSAPSPPRSWPPSLAARRPSPGPPARPECHKDNVAERVGEGKASGGGGWRMPATPHNLRAHRVQCSKHAYRHTHR